MLDNQEHSDEEWERFHDTLKATIQAQNSGPDQKKASLITEQLEEIKDVLLNHLQKRIDEGKAIKTELNMYEKQSKTPLYPTEREQFADERILALIRKITKLVKIVGSLSQGAKSLLNDFSGWKKVLSEYTVNYMRQMQKYQLLFQNLGSNNNEQH